MAGETRELPAVPPVAPLLARAAVTGLRRPGAATGLPAHSLAVLDHRQDPQRLAAYDRVCGFGLTDAVPATWLHVQTFGLQTALMAAPDFPFPLAGLVHVANTMTLTRRVVVGDRLRLSVHAENLAPHRRGSTFDVAAEVHVGDEPAWWGRSTYLARGSSGDEPREGTGAGGASAADPVLPAVSQRWRLPADLGRQYAAVSGDVNPIHLHPATARLFGFPRAIVHGMWTHARVLAALGGRLPQTYGASVRFTKPILLPGTVGFGAAATASGWDVAVLKPDGTTPYLVGHLDTA